MTATRDPRELASACCRVPAAEQDDGGPAEFRDAVASLAALVPREEISLVPIRAPRQLAPHSYALGAQVRAVDAGASGRLVLLHDPAGHEAWQGSTRLVAYVEADVEEAVASDSLLPEVAWSWLVDALTASAARYAALGGTVTATTSARFGELGDAGSRVAPDTGTPTVAPRTAQVEVRASWTAVDGGAQAHALAFLTLLAAAAGLPPTEVAALGIERRGGRS